MTTGFTIDTKHLLVGSGPAARRGRRVVVHLLLVGLLLCGLGRLLLLRRGLLLLSVEGHDPLDTDLAARADHDVGHVELHFGFWGGPLRFPLQYARIVAL